MNANFRRVTPAGLLGLITVALIGMATTGASQAKQQDNTVAIQDQIVLQYMAPLRSGEIILTLARDGADLVLRDGGTVIKRAPMAVVSAVAIGGPDNTNTSLTIDYAFGPIAVPIDYHPGALEPDTDNVLILRGAEALAETYTMAGPHAGTIERDGSPIRFVNLTPISDTTPALIYTFNVFGGTTINVVDGPVAFGFQTTQINDGGTGSFETTNIANKATVIINTIPSGATTFTVNNPNPGVGMTKLDPVGNGGGNTFNVSPSATVPISVQGTQMTLPNAPTDTLTINSAGVTNIALASVTNTFGVTGTYTFGNRAKVDFQNMATSSPIPPTAPIVCQQSVPAIGIGTLVAIGLLIGFIAKGWFARKNRASSHSAVA